MVSNRIDYLVEYLNERTKEYDLGNPSISDKDWDSLYFELKSLEEESGYIREDSPTQQISFKVVNELKKITHNHKMLSLEKTKSVDEVNEFLGNKPALAMCKMDGLTLSLRYVDGILQSAETRGDGFIGEDVTHNALVIPTIPNQIDYKNELIIDGEIICTYHNFEEFKQEYKNPRNFASGSIRLLDANECSKRKLTFVAWDIIKGLDIDNSDLNYRFNLLKKMGFCIVPYLIQLDKVTDESVSAIKEIAESNSYPIDGVVFKFMDVEYGRSLGETSHHFKNALAYKFYDETYSSKLLAIHWTMGRTGVLTPVAEFEPIEIDGSIVTRASLHNVSVMKDTLGDTPYLGQQVEVFKANQIIPQIKSAVKLNYGDIVATGGTTLGNLEKCPCCGSTEVDQEWSNDTIVMKCNNPSCEGKLVNKLDHFCGKKGLDIKGLSVSTLDKLIDWGWVNSFRDLYSLNSHREEWIKKPGFGIKSVDKILAAIEDSKKVELWRFLSAIGIPLIGSTYAKQMSKYEPSYFNIREDIDGGYDFTEWEGFGPEMNSAIRTFNYTEADWLWENVMEISNSLWEDPSKSAEVVKKPLENMSIVITGKLNNFKNRTELQQLIESAGGKVVGSISKNTSFLINNDTESTSSKNLAAKKAGIPIISEPEFLKKFFD